MYKQRKKPIKEFTFAVILCGIVEYFTSFFLEKFQGLKWWDYSGYFLNLNGRICAEGLLVFGVAGVLIVYFLAPILDDILLKVNKKILIVISILLTAIFAFDVVYSSFYPNTGTGITDYNVTEVIEE